MAMHQGVRDIPDSVGMAVQKCPICVEKTSRVKNRQDSTESSPEFRNFPLGTYSVVHRSTRTLYRTRGKLGTRDG